MFVLIDRKHHIVRHNKSYLKIRSVVNKSTILTNYEVKELFIPAFRGINQPGFFLVEMSNLHSAKAKA